MGITEEDINNGFQRFITNDILSEEQYLERETLMKIRSEYQLGRVKLAYQKSMVHNQITMTLFLLLNQQISESCQIFMLTLLIYWSYALIVLCATEHGLQICLTI